MLNARLRSAKNYIVQTSYTIEFKASRWALLATGFFSCSTRENKYNVVGLWDSAELYIVQIYVLFTNWSWTGTDSSACKVDEGAP